MKVFQVLYPASLGYRLTRGGPAHRDVFARVEPFGIREVDGAEACVVHEDRTFPVSYAMLDGLLWHRVMRGTGAAAGAGDLAAWLGGPGHLPTSPLSHAFRRTPLSWHDGRPGYEADMREGLRPPKGRAALDEADGAAAREEVRAWLDENVRICGGDILVRAGGPYVAFPDARKGSARPELRHHLRADGAHVAVGHVDAEALWRAHAAAPPGEADRPGPFPRWLRDLPPGSSGGRDVEDIVNGMPDSLLGYMELYRSRVRHTGTRRALGEAAGTLAGLCGRSRRGTLRGEGAEVAARVLAQVLGVLTGEGVRAIRPGDPTHRFFQREMGVRLAVIEGIILPRLTAMRAGEDEDAMQDLAP